MMAQEARTKRLFRPNLAKFTKDFTALNQNIRQAEDESWVWTPKKILDTAQSPAQPTNPNEDPRPMVLQMAPKEVSSSGVAYAKWCILTAALSFQLKAPEEFLKRLRAWWGDGQEPKYPLPASDLAWQAIFEEGEEGHQARIMIMTEIIQNKTLDVIAKNWEMKIASGRVFNVVDAARLAKTFPKSFADPFLFKAQRAIWQFTLPFIQLGQNLKIDLIGATDPQFILSLKAHDCVELHEAIQEKLNKGQGFIRDEIQERAVRSYLAVHSELTDFLVEGHPYEWRASKFQSETTDY